MKIFFPIGAFYPSQIGGPCNTVYWHTCELAKQDIAAQVVTTTIGIKEGQVKSDTAYSEKCGTVYYGKGGSGNPRTIMEALKSVKKNDLIHLNSLFNLLSIIVFFYTRTFDRKKQIIWSVRGELNQGALIYSRRKKKLLLFFYKRMCKNVVFHCTSEQEAIDTKAVFQNAQIIQIPNLIKPSERFSEVVNEKQLLYVGRIHPIKALHKIIEGLALSPTFVTTNAKLVIVGKYEERHKSYYESLLKLVQEKKLEDKVEFKGHLVGKEKERIYAKSYFTLLMSETENFGNVVVESLNQGTPVMASLGTPWGILENYKCGYHIANDPEVIGQHIDRLLQLDSETYAELRKNAVKLIENEFDIKTQIHRWINEYKKYANVKK
ncbi:glycosyltransferase family 4 protein [Flavobacterium cerinum]|uniref:Glycosyltransferase family 4 protein n=1 Tax=Flavobacterium cerinum TaxID=2502784 RepID=A0ABY5IW14_9FLAO|nr:glycosyltransferase family 4 protein [Flavobacterium cerinum]UUC47022.1 glycosyltransferase family 4 protein [Flavobacterium cerinum]